ncbi:MAG: alanine--tRNA ligase, partial [Verrucomicrobiales bacterium]|nr:alanine--tRNA ligase [Verrucomicrobiales bacterium]
MTASEIRQSFLDFFKSKEHTLVPSSSLLPDSPNLLFTNAGMNQFVPIFLAERKPDVCAWAGAVAARDTRAADTQKCIRAGGKHNDLEDVGLDTYHHTFFEMLGNWSFGDYFKREAIEWAWELLTGVWKFPKERLYATVYQPGEGDPAAFDQEAWDIWAALFRTAGLDPNLHIVSGNKKDNFWMMGDTGPCGPCSEIHMDLTPEGDTQGRLVNQGSGQCIEIWNLVFIQFNANPDGTFSSLPARHVDTGMGFERVAGIMQNTDGFKRFDRLVSNYETDVFRPLFDRLEMLSGKRYRSTLPRPDASGNLVPRSEQELIDVAFRVIGDHVRTLSFAIADGIQPGNTDRNYVLRRILRRGVRYGRSLGFHEPFLHLLVHTLVEGMGDVFPELRARQAEVEEVIRREEEAFNRTLDGGLRIFEDTLRIKQGMEKVVDAMAQRFDLVTAIANNPDLGLDDQGVEALYDGARLLLDFGRTIDRQLYQKILAASEESRLITTYAQRVVSEVERLRATGEALPKLATVREELG